MERFKRVFFDILTASISWVIFFYCRDIFIEETYSTADIWKITDIKILTGTIGVTIIWIVIYTLSGNYINVKRVSRLNELYRTVTQSVIGCLIIFFGLILNDIENYPNQNHTLYYQALLTLGIIHFLLTFFTRYILTNSMVKKIQQKKITFPTILIGNSTTIKKIFHSLEKMPKSTGNQLLGYINCDNNKTIEEINIPNLGNLNSVENIITTKKIEEAIIALDKDQLRKNINIIHILIYHDIITKITPNLADLLAGKVKMQSLLDLPFVEIKKIKMSFFERFLKRTIDITFSIIALLMLSPFLITISLIVKLSSKGPVFYYQERLGHHNKPFKIIKFRSMHINSEKETPLLSSHNDQRITKWGKIMRKYRLDELPQFYNVLIGDMSIIGPRPERSFFAKQIIKQAPHYKLIHKVKPGITSWGMVKFGYAENISEMIERLKYDIIYLENLSLLNDFKVFALTIVIILQGRGK